MGIQNPDIYSTNYQGVENNLTPPNHRTPVWLAWLNALLYPLQWLHNNFFNTYANGSSAPFYNSTTTYTLGKQVIDTDNNVYTLFAAPVTGFVITAQGTGYTNGTVPLIIEGGGGSGAAGTATISGSKVTGVTLTSGGSGYTYAPAISVAPNPGGSGAIITATVSVTGVQPSLNIGTWLLICNDYRGVRPRTLYNSQKLVLEGVLNQYFRTTFRQPPYTTITGINLTNAGAGYTSFPPPAVVITGQDGIGSGAFAEAIVPFLGNTITQLNLISGGNNYLNPTVSIVDPFGSPSIVATAQLVTTGNNPPDIFIVNHVSNNDVFVVGMTEDQSSLSVYSNSEGASYVEYTNGNYSFDDPNDINVSYDFIIYVPLAVYYALAPTPVIGLSITTPGHGYETGAQYVTFTGGGGSGAVATISNTDYPGGFMNYPFLVKGGSGYTSPPTVTIPYPTDADPVEATAVAIIDDFTQNNVRANVIRNFADKYVIAGMQYKIATY